jgi:hypothetical protein
MKFDRKYLWISFGLLQHEIGPDPQEVAGTNSHLHRVERMGWFIGDQ